MSLLDTSILSSYSAWQKEQTAYSSATLRSYFTLAQNFLHAMDAQERGRLNDVDSDTVRTFIRYKKDGSSYSAASIKVREAALHVFFSWAYSQKLVRDNPVVGYKRAKIRSKAIPLTSPSLPVSQELLTLTQSEQKKLLAYPVASNFLDTRNHCLAVLFLLSGLRVEEMLRLHKKDIALKKGIITLPKRKVAIETFLFEKIYRQWLRLHPLRTQPNFPLWVTRQGQVLTRRSLHSSLSTHLDKVGLAPSTNARTLRQTAMRNALQKEKNIEKVQKLFGIRTYAHAKRYA